MYNPCNQWKILGTVRGTNIMKSSNYYPLMSNALMLVRFVCEQLTEDSNKLLWIDFGLD